MQLICLVISALSAIALAETTLAAPTPDMYQGTVAISKRDQVGCVCGSATGGFQKKCYVKTTDDKLGPSIARGLLDNLRGQCQDIQKWTAGDSGNGIDANFLVPFWCDTFKVHDAIWLASNPNKRIEAKCEMQDNGDPNVAGKMVDIGTELAGAAIGAK